MEKIIQIKQQAKYLRLSLLHNQIQHIIHTAQLETPSYLDFTHALLSAEIEFREQSDLARRLKVANLPGVQDLNLYETKSSAGISQKQLDQLRELLWVEQLYNLILMGPSGTGKTFLAAGLVNDAINNGLRAYFTTMQDLVLVLNRKELTSSARGAYARYQKAHLIAIDDIMLFPLKKHEALAFFHLINHLHQRCSIIITTNKSPKQWAEALDDEVLATALLDRILFHCEVVKLEGKSYRMDNRRTIFTPQS